MWSPVVTTAPPAAEPVSVDDAKEFCSIDAEVVEFDALLGSFITAARQHAETMTGTRFAEQTVVLRASCFSDLAKLPIGPVSAIDEIVYDDTAGVEQALDPADYELAGAGLQQSVRPAYGVTWPAARSVEGSIRITATVGYAALGEDLKIAILLMVSDLFAFRETAVTGTVAQSIPTSMPVMAILNNHRIWL